ncbi:hypothetical protein [Porphyromonas sp.]|uniref:hypothetical protein n=1 Tax=Porphyromonas sp. TaxID=1924944 RepID=UPI0026DC7969|nr:hypothetical protein [Porphyromonas sp.]MDO4771799.1 hypothetical protein [Porphyromonas sp.]
MKTNAIKLLISFFLVVGYGACQSKTLFEAIPDDKVSSDAHIRQDVSGIGNVGDVDSELLRYYQNIASMAEWYALHPQIVADYREQMSKPISDNISGAGEHRINTVIEKLLDMKFEAPDGRSMSFFDLEPGLRKSFLSEMPRMEARFVAEKVHRLGNKNSADAFRSQLKKANKAFDDVFHSATLRSSEEEDPYWKIREAMTQTDGAPTPRMSSVAPNIIGTAVFWTLVFAASEIAVIFDKQPSIDPEILLRRIKGRIEKGRLLIALPGDGIFGNKSIVRYTGSETWDFGHVAVFSKTKNEIDEDIARLKSEGENPFEKLQITIGTDKDKNMRYESFMEDWANLHPFVYVGQIFDVKYKFWSRGIFRWGWKRVQTDVNNDVIYSQALKSIGTYYCNWFQVLTAKYAAPKRLICSSAAWWYAKKGVKVNIGDWWKPTIFPGGVYYSDRVRIIW